MRARPPNNFLGATNWKIAIGAYSSELITPQRKRIYVHLKRLWNHNTMAYKVYVRPWPLAPRGKHSACTLLHVQVQKFQVLAILSKFSAVGLTPGQTFTLKSPRGALQVWKILRILTHKRRWTIRLKYPSLHYESFVYGATLCSSIRSAAAAWRLTQKN